MPSKHTKRRHRHRRFKQKVDEIPVNQGAGPSTGPLLSTSSESSEYESVTSSEYLSVASSVASDDTIIDQAVDDDPSPHYRHYKSIEGHHLSITALKFSACGHWLASCADDRLIKIWNVQTGKLMKELIGHKDGISDVAWNDDSTKIASASDDQTVKIWNVNLKLRKPKVIRKFNSLKDHEEIVMCCIWKNLLIKNEIITILASGGHDDCVRIWKVDGESVTPWHVLKGHTEPITSIDFSVDGHLLASSSYDGSVRIWETKEGTYMMSVVKDAMKPVSFVKFNPMDDEFVLIGTLDSKIKLWNFIKWKDYVTYEGHYNSKFCIVGNFCFGKYIVAGNEDNKIYIWSIGGGNVVQTLIGHSGIVLCTAVHPFTNVIASAGLDGEENRIQLWKSDVTSSWSTRYIILNQPDQDIEEC